MCLNLKLCINSTLKEGSGGGRLKAAVLIFSELFSFTGFITVQESDDRKGRTFLEKNFTFERQGC